MDLLVDMLNMDVRLMVFFFYLEKERKSPQYCTRAERRNDRGRATINHGNGEEARRAREPRLGGGVAGTRDAARQSGAIGRPPPALADTRRRSTLPPAPRSPLPALPSPTPPPHQPGGARARRQGRGEARARGGKGEGRLVADAEQQLRAPA